MTKSIFLVSSSIIPPNYNLTRKSLPLSRVSIKKNFTQIHSSPRMKTNWRLKSSYYISIFFPSSWLDTSSCCVRVFVNFNSGHFVVSKDKTACSWFLLTVIADSLDKTISRLHRLRILCSITKHNYKQAHHTLSVINKAIASAQWSELN